MSSSASAMDRYQPDHSLLLAHVWRTYLYELVASHSCATGPLCWLGFLSLSVVPFAQCEALEEMGDAKLIAPWLGFKDKKLHRRRLLHLLMRIQKWKRKDWARNQRRMPYRRDSVISVNRILQFSSRGGCDPS